MNKTLRFLIAGVVMGAFAYLLQSLDVNLFANLGASILVYFVLLAALKEPLLKEARSMLRGGAELQS